MTASASRETITINMIKLGLNKKSLIQSVCSLSEGMKNYESSIDYLVEHNPILALMQKSIPTSSVIEIANRVITDPSSISGGIWEQIWSSILSSNFLTNTGTKLRDAVSD